MTDVKAADLPAGSEIFHNGTRAVKTRHYPFPWLKPGVGWHGDDTADRWLADGADLLAAGR